MRFWLGFICFFLCSQNIFASTANYTSLVSGIEKYSSIIHSKLDVSWAIDLGKEEKRNQIIEKNKKIKYINVIDFGADSSGQSDSTQSIQKAIDFASTIKDHSAVVLFPSGSYLLSKEIHLRSHLRLQAKKATIYGNSWRSFGAFFTVDDGVSNVVVSGFIFDGKGTLLNYEFVNPYYINGKIFTEKANGFSNNHVGVYLSAHASDIFIKDNEFKGLGLGVYSKGSNIYIDNNFFYDMGLCAIRIENASYNFIKNNKIDKIYGGMNTVLNAPYDQKSFADGIYIYASSNVVVFNNEISRCKRIGIVVEGDGKAFNEKILIMHNFIKKITGSTGGEFNAGVWVEGGRVKYNSVIIADNNISEIGGVNNGKYSHGIFSCDSIVYRNQVFMVYGSAIFSKNSTILKNDIHDLYNNGYKDIGAIFIKWQDDDSDVTYIYRNSIINTDIPALFVSSGVGRVLVGDNLFSQNGSDLSGYMCSVFVLFNMKNNGKVEFFDNVIKKYSETKYKKCVLGYLFSVVLDLKGSTSYPVFLKNSVFTGKLAHEVKFNTVFYGGYGYFSFDFSDFTR